MSLAVAKMEEGMPEEETQMQSWKRQLWGLFVQDTQDKHLGEVLVQHWGDNLPRFKEAPAIAPRLQ